MVSHADWPQWTFVLTINSTGAVVGFEMHGDGQAAGTDPLTDLRLQGPTVVPPADAPQVTARLLKAVPHRDLEVAVRAWVRKVQGIYASPDVKARLAQLKTTRPAAGRRLTWTLAETAALCAEYVGLLDAGDPAPVRTLAARYHRSEKRIRNLLSSARGELLTASPPGRAGGQLTNKAKEILSGDHQAP